MALKILLADDSMTAQNMGKKILTDAGYEVVAVSNGAQAVKKIASEKPDLAVLDVFMPGYSGLEVCERIKKAQETAHIPVLLTVGKMEPFKAEEGTRAGADGLIVKPFEASDLLAALKKIEEKLAAPAAEPEEDTHKAPVVEEFQDTSYEEWKVSAPAHAEEEEELPVAPKLEVPKEMSAAPAFGMDLEEHAAPEPPARITAAIEPPPAERTMAMDPSLMNRDTAIIEPPAAERSRATAEMPAPLQAAAGASAAHAPEAPAAKVELPPELAVAAAIPAIAADDLAMTGHMKAMLEPEQKAAEHHEVEFTSAPKAIDVEHAPAPGFEPTVSQETIHVGTGRDPALVTDNEELSKFTTKFGVEGAEPITVGLASEMPELYADSQPAAEPAAAAADADFEARVAAAMAGYEEPTTQEIPALVPEPVPAAAPAPSAFVPEPPAPEPIVEAPEPTAEPGQDTATFIAQMQEAVQNLPVDTTPHVEAAAEPVAVPAPAPEPVAENVPDHALAAAMAAAVGGTVEPQVAAPVVQAAAAAAAKGVDPQLIADVVHRVVERMKPDLAAEIAKELESILKK